MVFLLRPPPPVTVIVRCASRVWETITVQRWTRWWTATRGWRRGTAWTPSPNSRRDRRPTRRREGGTRSASAVAPRRAGWCRRAPVIRGTSWSACACCEYASRRLSRARCRRGRRRRWARPAATRPRGTAARSTPPGGSSRWRSRLSSCWNGFDDRQCPPSDAIHRRRLSDTANHDYCR